METYIRRMVSHSIDKYAKNDTISKSELQSILTDVLTQFCESRELSETVGKKTAFQQQREDRIKGIIR